MSYQFNLRDDREASVELAHTYLVVTDPTDVAFHIQAFECADRLAAYGEDAARIIEAVQAEL